MKKEQKSLHGYFTVEATLIMSITLVCIVLLIYLGFYQYNRCLITQDTYRLSLKGSSMQFTDNEAVYQKVSQEYNGYYWNKYMAMKMSEPLIEVDGAKVAVTIEGKMPMPFSWFRKWNITKNSESKRIVPTEIIRILKRLEVDS